MTALARWRVHWRPHVIAVGALLLVWLALWGRVTTALVLSGIALAVVILVAFPLPTITTSLGLHPLRAVAALVRFLGDVVVASIQVSYLAVRRRPPATDVVTVSLATTSDLIQHLTALAVSLVPGSLIIDADPARRTLTIHVLYATPRSPDRFVAAVLAQERRIQRALGEEAP